MCVCCDGVFRSPGGTPARKRRSRGNVCASDPAALIAEALKRKFAHRHRDNSFDKENRSAEPSPFSSPDTPRVRGFELGVSRNRAGALWDIVIYVDVHTVIIDDLIILLLALKRIYSRRKKKVTAMLQKFNRFILRLFVLFILLFFSFSDYTVIVSETFF